MWYNKKQSLQKWVFHFLHKDVNVLHLKVSFFLDEVIVVLMLSLSTTGKFLHCGKFIEFAHNHLILDRLRIDCPSVYLFIMEVYFWDESYRYPKLGNWFSLINRLKQGTIFWALIVEINDLITCWRSVSD